jgi:protein required for attachment to host cells
MNKVWILVANASRGRIYETQQGEDADWRLVEAFTHPSGRSHTDELVTDGAGRNASQGRSVHHNAMVPKTSPKEVEKEHFVHALVTALDHGLRTNLFDHLVLAAPAHVLGMLKKALTPQLAKHLLATSDKDFEHLDAKELSERLASKARIPIDQADVVRNPEGHAH